MGDALEHLIELSAGLEPDETDPYDLDGEYTLDPGDLELAKLCVPLTPEAVALARALFGSKGKLDRSPKSNWVEDNGGLPGYVEEVANALHTRRGMTISHAIAAALSRMKVWAVTGKPDTKAKAIKALAQWEALKARAKAKKALK